ncbi:MAG TPA: ABC transporter substrate-binding protein [Gaiellaceae bacterium]|jgi:multiple sugar transport system substrate-binding protein|nr:ABC transporter substrate-binding protein [Gaiellaceae bacterium]
MSEHELPFERRPLTRRRLVELGAGFGATLVLAGCGGGKSAREATGQTTAEGPAASGYDGPNVELQFWNGFTGGDGPFMREMVDQFNGEHENITVKMVVQQWGDYYQKVPQAVASGRGPDVGIMHVDTLATNAARNVIVPLDDLAQTLGLTEDDYNTIVWNAGVYQDQRYGIPLDIHPLGFYYNTQDLEKAGIDEPPQTRDEHDEALEKLKSAGIQHPFWQSSTWPAHLMFTSLLKQFGGEIVNEDATEATFNSDAGVQALEWMVNLVKEGYSPKNVAQDADYIAFKNQKNSFHWDGIWQTQDLAKTKVPWGVAPIPQIGDEKGAWAGSHNLVLMRQPRPDENKTQAGKVFINWISEHSIEWAKAGQVPARTSVAESEEFKSLEHQPTFAEQEDYVVFFPSHPGIGDTIAEMEQAVNRAVLMKQPPKQALDEAAGRAKKLLEANKKKYGGS